MEAGNGMIENLPLVVIAGPTASGKTALAVKMAEQYKGEIICADSRTVYRYMDIGTAKPTHEEQARVPHWGLDLVSPDQRFTAADFKQYAEEKIKEIRARNHTPFLVGGTGLYIDSVLFNYQFGNDIDESLRNRLQAMSIESLQNYCSENNINLPENSTNRRYLIRAIEQNGINHKSDKYPIKNTIIVGISTEKEILRTRIAHRAEHIFDDGVVEEAIKLGKMYGWESEAMTGNIYPLIHVHLDGLLTLQEVQQKFMTLDWRLAKRQMTWLRRNPYIEWKSLEEAEHYLTEILARTATS